MDKSIQEELKRASELVLSARYVVAVVGAGMSAESGIPTFRGPGGLWNKYGEPDMRGFERFLADPKTWWRNMLKGGRPGSELQAAVEKAQPNPGHHALAELERLGVLRYIITQNVDGLHHVAGSTRVAEIHGNTRKLRCLRCTARFDRRAFEIDVEHLPPRCPECGGVVKGDGVMFGEPIPEDVLAICQEQTAASDCMLLLGTSGVVYPAAGFPQQVKWAGGRLIEINPLETDLSHLCDVVVRAPTGEALPELTKLIGELKTS
ncbi:MAG: NAD-dependent deacylase [SAR202 cluster bacterium]|nr:NAD-dependent deacylase [SAR202 cluster bacterium]